MISYLEKFLKARLAIELQMIRKENKAAHPKRDPKKSLQDSSIPATCLSKAARSACRF